MKKIFVMAMIGLSLTQNTAHAKDISDSLVQNLSCSSLSVSSILAKVRPEAYSSRNHMPLTNWPFKSGLTNLAACWGMGSTQRKLFYLLRTNVKDAPRLDVSSALDMVRGASVSGDKLFSYELEDASLRANEATISNYKVYNLEESNIRDEYGRNNGHGFMDLMFRGVGARNLRSEIERSQERHFFRSSNIGMGAGTGPRGTSENRDTLKTLIANMKAHRLTLINLRLRRTVQHIVIPKTYKEDAKGVWMWAYDSNSPDTDQKIYYSKANGHFYAPQIMGAFDGDYSGTDYTRPLGVFIVDEQERADIENSLLSHYKKRCQ
jgi:hypothetical protein